MVTFICDYAEGVWYSAANRDSGTRGETWRKVAIGGSSSFAMAPPSVALQHEQIFTNCEGRFLRGCQSQGSLNKSFIFSRLDVIPLA
jgi:hypothetical protein